MAKLIISIEIYSKEYGNKLIYVVEFQRYGTTKTERTFKSKSAALKFVKSYMRKH